MSDEFDKEAEREKLRKKFARDEEKREHTQRMSELLLKGATMTNKHCESCSDPIFRHDGREFCPTCNQPANEAASGSAQSEPGSGQSTTESENSTTATTHRTAAADDSTTATEAAARPNTGAGNGTGSIDHAPSATSAPSEQATDPRQPRDGEQSTNTGASGVDQSGSATPPAHDPQATRGGDEDLAAIRASLTRTLGRFARAAEETDDPRRARDHLRAAREAAETLAALEQ